MLSRRPRTALAVALFALTPLLAMHANAAVPKGLPRLAPTALPAPEASTTTELEQVLAQIASAKSDDQKAGQVRLTEDAAQLLPAMSRKLSELRKSMNRDLVSIQITDARKARSKKGDDDDADKPKKKRKKDDVPKDAKTDGSPENDWLTLVIAKPKSGDSSYKDLVSVLAIERALVSLGTTAAVRTLIDVFVDFGDLFRIDVQQMIGRLGDKAVPALLEARKHDNEKVRRWASRQLDTLGRVTPGEAVQVQDPDVLADVLRAYGRTKDIEALRVITSFTSSDRVHVREAAREALDSYGEAALWQLREAIESTTGKRPPAGTAWDKLATDLFEAHDRARLDEIFGIFEEGLAKQKDGKLDEMAQKFDDVLARTPSFERRGEMVDGYVAYARSVENADAQKAILYARKALRLDPQGDKAKSIESYAWTLEGEEMLAHGLADTAAFKRAIDLDTTNGRAKDDLARVESNPRARVSGAYRYLAAAAIGLFAVIAAFIVGVWKRTPAPQKEPKEA